jgi:hypothetical protein
LCASIQQGMAKCALDLPAILSIWKNPFQTTPTSAIVLARSDVGCFLRLSEKSLFISLLFALSILNFYSKMSSRGNSAERETRFSGYGDRVGSGVELAPTKWKGGEVVKCVKFNLILILDCHRSRACYEITKAPSFLLFTYRRRCCCS